MPICIIFISRRRKKIVTLKDQQRKFREKKSQICIRRNTAELYFSCMYCSRMTLLLSSTYNYLNKTEMADERKD